VRQVTGEEKLFSLQVTQVLNNSQHILHQLLPCQSTTSQNYNLRPRIHDKELLEKTTRLTYNKF